MCYNKTVIVLLVAILGCSALSAKTYYVAPSNSSDYYPGDKDHPWATWQHAINSAYAGDTVYFRGGVWYPTSDTYGGNIIYLAPQYGFGHTGTRDNPICFFNYPGENPILDCSLVPILYSGANALAVEGAEGDNHLVATHYKFRGLTIRNLPQKPDKRMRGIVLWEVGNISMEQMVSHDVGGEGFVAMSYDTISFINCDSYNHQDSSWTNPDIGIADGFFIHDANAGGVYPYNFCTISGCRAWNCKDDGFDIGGQSEYHCTNNWSFLNGGTGTGDPGSGFKFSGSYKASYSAKIIANNLAAFNYWGNGIEFNNLHQYIPGMVLGHARGSVLNNTIYKCYTGTGNSPWNYEDTAYVKYTNNLIYNCWGPVEYPGYYAQTYFTRHLLVSDISHNTWVNTDMGDPGWTLNPAYNVTTDDFVLTDSIIGVNQMTSPRKADGSLPDITFLTLKTGSDLIDRGKDIGLPYKGSAPDLGYAEYGVVTTNPSIPEYVTSVIENSTPSKLDISYSLPLANIVPSSSSFIVTVNSLNRGISAISISGNKLLLTLSSPVGFGDVVTFSYSKPDINPIQTIAGGKAVSCSNRIVENNVTPNRPVYISSVVENITPSRVEITFSLTLSNIVPAPSAFTVNVNSSLRNISSITVSGIKVYLNLSSPIVFGDIVTVTYVNPALNPIQTPQGGLALPFTSQSVINNCSTTSNQPPLIMIISPLKSQTLLSPANITIEADVYDADGTIVKVEFFNGNFKLGEKNSSPYSFTWKNVGEGIYLITAVATDNRGAKTVSEAVSVIVEKSSTAINQLPVVNIISPNKSRKYKKNSNIDIKVEASDPDGIINNVEIKNGEQILAILTTSPYNYTMTNVDTGNYYITAIATDNYGASSTSSALELLVVTSMDYMNLFPNPSSGHFTVSLSSQSFGKDCRLSVVNLSGSIIWSCELPESESIKELDLSFLMSGTYALIITRRNQVIATNKIVKQ